MKRIVYVMLLTFIMTIMISISNISYGSQIQNISQLAGKKVGCVSGMIHDAVLLKVCPEAIPQYYNSITDCLAALKAGKIEAYIDDQPTAIYTTNTMDFITYIPDLIYTNDYGYIFNQSNAELKEQVDAVLVEMKKDGTLQ